MRKRASSPHQSSDSGHKPARRRAKEIAHEEGTAAGFGGVMCVQAGLSNMPTRIARGMFQN